MVFKLFVDTNVYLDFLMQRGNDWQYAEVVFQLAEYGAVEIFTSSSSLVNIMYVMKTYKQKRENIIANMLAILSYTNVVNPDSTTFDMALSSEFVDLEDGVQYFTALEIKNIDYFITTNIKDFKSALSRLPAVKASDFMKIYNKHNKF